MPAEGPIPAHLLGNMWAQQWGNVYDLVGVPATGPGYDLTALLRGQDRWTRRRWSATASGSSPRSDSPPLPPTFWERSLFTKPHDRDVVCHASAWDIDNDQDLRIKMCIQINGEDFVTIHHELGHNIYQRAYRTLPFVYRGSANDGFHEAIGDAVALSVTPDYLVKVGLLGPGARRGGRPRVPDAHGARQGRIPALRPARRSVALAGVLGRRHAGPATTSAWWELRRKYQNVARAGARAASSDFDPGAKYHVPANTPYSRYFLAHILQFQFHRAMCREAGYTGPLHRCSVYGNKQVGAKLAKMLEMGQSKPWPDALEALTGERQDGRDGDSRLLRAAQASGSTSRRSLAHRAGRTLGAGAPAAPPPTTRPATSLITSFIATRSRCWPRARAWRSRFPGAGTAAAARIGDRTITLDDVDRLALVQDAVGLPGDAAAGRDLRGAQGGPRHPHRRAADR